MGRGEGSVNLIDQPGVYQVPEADYHRKEICAGPSISSSGLRAIANCPAKYWWNSPLNPNRPEQSEARHFTFGRAAHDLVLDGVGWPSRYHILPEGFKANATVAQAKTNPAVIAGAPFVPIQGMLINEVSAAEQSRIRAKVASVYEKHKDSIGADAIKVVQDELKKARGG